MHHLAIFTLVYLAFMLDVTFSIPCINFDSDFNLFVFGVSGKDYSLGTQDQWSSGDYFNHLRSLHLALTNSNYVQAHQWSFQRWKTDRMSNRT